MSRTTMKAAAVLAAVPLLAAGPAQAHGLVARTDLPVPQWLFAWSAAVVLVVSFVGLSVLWDKPRFEERRDRTLAAVPRLVPHALSAFGLLAFLLVVWAGLTGSGDDQANIAPTAVYVVFWVGLPFVCLLLGNVFDALSPWRTIARVARWAGGRGGRQRAVCQYPEKLGRWPAAFMVLAFTWAELVATNGDDPQVVAVLALVYAAAQLVGMAVYGIDPWTRNADGLAVYFHLFARMAPLHWTDREVRRQPPLAGLPSLRPAAGTVALLCVMIGSTSFDGATGGPVWRDAGADLTNAFEDLGLGDRFAYELAWTLGLLVSIALIAALYAVGVAGMANLSQKLNRADLAARFAHSLVPIALAYVLAHYFSLLVFQGQALGYLLSDPRGTGADVLGTADWRIDYGAVSATAIWYVQVGALVVGHVAALVLAHDRALASFTQRLATRSQYWMLTVMVGYTSLGLWLLSSVGT